MIYISFKNLLIKYQKLHLTNKESSRFYMVCKSLRELLMPGEIFAVNRYKCLLENKNKIRTFGG